MAEVYQAIDVRAAVRIAAEFKASGKYDWFRGQLEIWPLRSTRARLRPDQEEDALDRLARFEQWLKSTPGLEAIAADVDAAFAVGQHYGLPTNYIDFTTSPEVAGFFASDHSGRQPPAGKSCIICLNTRDLGEFWEALPPKYPPPQFVRLSVPNLWRLEAQEGCFLFCPYPDFEKIYDLDRIYFPYTGPAANIPRGKIYPDRKSALEILLDQFFMAERAIEGSRRLEQMPGFRDMTKVRIEDAGGWERELFRREPEMLESWSEARLREWIEPRVETFSGVSGAAAIRLDPAAAVDRIEAAILERLGNDGSLRARAVEWDAGEPLASRLARLWDGIRSLPYDAAQVAHGMAQCVALWRAVGGRNIGLEETMRSAAEACFGDAIEIGIDPGDGSYSLAFAGERLLLGAVRKDLADYLEPEWAPQIDGNMTGILQAIQEPRRAYDFPALADVFVRQIAPFQAVFRPGKVAHFYSPARIRRLGPA